MRPLAVLIGIVMGSAVSLAVGLALTWVVFLFLPEQEARLAAEKGPLMRAVALVHRHGCRSGSQLPRGDAQPGLAPAGARGAGARPGGRGLDLLARRLKPAAGRLTVALWLALPHVRLAGRRRVVGIVAALFVGDGVLIQQRQLQARFQILGFFGFASRAGTSRVLAGQCGCRMEPFIDFPILELLMLVRISSPREACHSHARSRTTRVTFRAARGRAGLHLIRAADRRLQYQNKRSSRVST